MTALYPAMDMLGQVLYLLMLVAMTIRGWWRRFPIFYAVQAIQFAETLWVLYLCRTANLDMQRSVRFELFWPNLAAELLVLITCFVSVNRETLWWIGIANMLHLFARYLWSATTDIATRYNLGREYFFMALTNLAIYPVVLWVLYSSRGNQPQEKHHVRSEQRSGRLEETSPQA